MLSNSEIKKTIFISLFFLSSFVISSCFLPLHFIHLYTALHLKYATINLVKVVLDNYIYYVTYLPKNVCM